MERTTWTDERLDERMTAIDNTHDRIFDELHAFRAEMREFRAEFKTEMREFRAEVRGDLRDLRIDLNAQGDRLDRFQDRMVQVGFGLVAVLIAAIVTIVLALA